VGKKQLPIKYQESNCLSSLMCQILQVRIGAVGKKQLPIKQVWGKSNCLSRIGAVGKKQLPIKLSRKAIAYQVSRSIKKRQDVTVTAPVAEYWPGRAVV
jgi:hypothetical protein